MSVTVRSGSRYRFLGTVGVVFGAVVLAAFTVLIPTAQNSAADNQEEGSMDSSSAQQSIPEGPGSVWGAPNLPPGFTDTFTSQYIDTGDVRLHAVIGGGGPPLLLVHGWPETWYAWRL